MKTRFAVLLASLCSLAVVLALPACRLLTDSNSNVALTSGHTDGSDDSTGTGGPPPAPTGFSIGVSGDSMATAGSQAYLQLFAENHDAGPDTVNYRFTGPQGWSGFPVIGALAVLGMTSATATIAVEVPVGTEPGPYLFHYEIEKTNGSVLQSGDFALSVHPR